VSVSTRCCCEGESPGSPLGNSSDRSGGGPPSELLANLFSLALENVLQGIAHIRTRNSSRRCHSWACCSPAKSTPNSTSNASTVQPHQASAKLIGARRPQQKSAAKSAGGSAKTAPRSAGRSASGRRSGCAAAGASQASGRSWPGPPQRLAVHLSCHFFLSLPGPLFLSLPEPLEPLPTIWS
jgi:hypothetical protein